ncbi:MAG: TldD/PmbA family protein [Spirochaetia bacterium]|nr:TldD/PmbA family protein [Spirochaetia bacterium]
MNTNKAQNIIQAGLEAGADFSEIFIEETRSSSLSLKDGKVETAFSGISYGIGIRLLFNTEVLYAFTSNDDEEILISMVKELAKSREGSSLKTVHEISFKEALIDDIHLIRKDPAKTPLSNKLELIKRANISARETDSKIVQAAARAIDSVRHIKIFNSEGLSVSDSQTRCRFVVSATAANSSERFEASESPGELRGFEFFDHLNVEKCAREAAERALLMLDAGYIEGKKMPVILGNGFGGVIFHEACGHPLETEAIRRSASPFTGKLGQKIAHESLTAIDDGTIPNGWGSINIDDEGYPAQKTILIENGILKSYMSDKVGAIETNTPRTGSARRESFRFAPVSRMRNTYIAAGSHSVDNMLSSVDFGLFAKKMGGGSVDPATGEFNFAVSEGYIVKNGKIEKPVRGATLIGKGHEIMQKISMSGDDLEITAGTCGASSGWVPVTVGQPTIKVDEILVGGR